MKHQLVMLISCFPLLSTAANAHSCETGSTPDIHNFDNARRNQQLEGKLHELFQCIPSQPPGELTANDLTACNWFVGKALRDIWGHDDFYYPDLQRFLTTTEIANLSADEMEARGWEDLGPADSQATLMSAEANAYSGRAVFALMPGHIALILPGGTVHSPSWKLDVPMAAQLRIHKIEKAFVGCSLSWSFKASDQNKVHLYTKPGKFRG